ncbi:MAG: HYR domain-containing protein [Flavobacterium sp.]
MAFLSLFCCFSMSLFAQGTSPVAQNLPYVQDFSLLESTSITYPTGLQGWTASTAPGSSYNTNAVLIGDRALTASSSASTTSGNVHNYNGKIGFLNSGSLDLTIGLAINTVAKSGIVVQYDAMVIRNPYDGTANTRINEMILQYRIGDSSIFTTLPTTSYVSNTVKQTTAGVTSPLNPVTITVILPAECDNQEVVQLRWISKQNSGSGSRPSFAIDNITIQNDITPPVYADGYPKIENILSNGFDLSIQVNEIGKTYFVLLASGSAKPSASQIKSGLDANGNTALQSGIFDVTDSALTYTKSISNLTLGTDYVVYVISEDFYGNIQTDSTQLNVKTSTTLVPSISTTKTALDFGFAEQNFASKTSSYQIQAQHLNDVVTVTASNNFTISKNPNDNFQSSLVFDVLDFDASNAPTVYVRFTPTAMGNFSGQIEHQTSGASTKTILVSGVGINPYSQNFNDVNVLTNSGWTAYSVAGDKIKWASTSSRFNSSPAAVLINGYAENGASKDWLISPKLHLDSFDKFPLLSFYSRKFYSGPNLKLMVSVDYDGTSSPETATWTELEGDFPSTTGVFKASRFINLAAYKTDNTYVAWVYETTASGGDNAAEWTIDDVSITNEATFLASNPNLNFSETNANSTSDSQSFIFMAGGYGDFTITAPSNYQLALDNTNFQSSLVVATNDALAGKTIYARFAPLVKALNLEGSLTVTSTGLNQQIGHFTGSSFPKAETFDIVSYNLEFFGSDVVGTSGEFGPIDDALQVENVAKVMNKLNADVYVVQEVSDEAALETLIQKISINGKTYDKSISPAWSYSFSPPDPLFPPQKLVVIYNTQTTKVNKTRVMFTDLYDNIRAGNTSLPNYPGGNSSSFFASGRLPYLVNIETNINGVKKEMNIIDLHGRANSGTDISKYNMRKYDAELLKDSLDVEYPNANFMILGDYNDDVDVSVITPNPSSYQKMVEDTARYNALTLEISKAGAYSYLASGGFLDHIIISNELTNDYIPNSVAVYDPRLDISNYVNTTSDHGPVIARFDLKKAAQSINFPSITITAATSYDLNATATSGLAITYVSSNEGIAKISNGKIQILSAGTVTITASQLGNEYYLAAADVNQSLTITDKELPVIVAPATITQSNDTGICGAKITYVTPIGTDNFPGATTVQTAGLASGTVFPIGTTTNTFEVTDASGNTATASFNVIVNDTELPIIICPENIIQKKEGRLHGAIVTYSTPVGTDNCSGITITQTSGLASGSVFPLGTTTNTFKVVDAAGNTTNCSFTVNIVKALPPDHGTNGGFSIKAYPNPATDFVNFTVKTDKPKNMSLKLYDLLGFLVAAPVEITGNATENTVQIDVSRLRKGIYIYTLSTGNKILFIDKIIKK